MGHIHGVRESHPSRPVNYYLLLATGSMRKGMCALELENECAIAFVLLLHLLVTDSSSTQYHFSSSLLGAIRHSHSIWCFL